MTTKDEALKLALEALNEVSTLYMSLPKKGCMALAAIEEVLAQPEGCQCPACKIAPHTSDCAVHNAPAYPVGKCDCGAQPEQEHIIDCPRCGHCCTQPAQQQEPVAKVVLTETLGLPCLQWLDLDKQFDFKGGEFIYTSPPASKPLTDEEIEEIWNRYCDEMGEASVNDEIGRASCRERV